MTGPNFAYDPNDLIDTAAELKGLTDEIDTTLNRLEGQLEGELATWNGEAREQYRLHKDAWDRAIIEMNSIISGQAVPALQRIQQGYSDAETRVSRSFSM